MIFKVTKNQCVCFKDFCYKLPGNNWGPQMAGQQPCSSYPWKLTSLHMAELEELTLQQDKHTIHHDSYFTVMHHHPLNLLL
jgi:hypothetical protein